MESLIYVLIHLYNGTVPWQFVEVLKDDNFVNIMNYKRLTPSSKLAQWMPFGFIKIVDYIRNLKFLDIPDYDYIRWCLKEILLENSIQINQSFNWDTDMKKRSDRHHLVSKSSKNLKTNILMRKQDSRYDALKRNNSLNKKKTRCDMFKPLAKSRWWRVCSNSESVAGAQFNRQSSNFSPSKGSIINNNEDNKCDSTFKVILIMI
jgi:hypothetical protein